MKKHIVFLLTLLSGFFFGLVHSQTLIINEVSNGPAGSQEYVEFVVVDVSATYDCTGSAPPCVDIRGWIYDDNSGYHGTSGIASGCARFTNDPLWSCVPVGTIILLYNGLDPNPDIPADDVSLLDGNCVLSVSLENPQFFEFTETTPGDIVCSYPAAGWGTDPSPNWSNVAMANGGDCARLVDLNGCEVFSLCYGAANLNPLIYFTGVGNDDVWFFNGGDPALQANWSEGCAGDIAACGTNDQTPGAPNNVANADFIGQFNNYCAPIPPIVVTSASIDAGCGCTGTASITASGSIPGYTYEWYDIAWLTTGQTNDIATNLCAGTYYGIATSSIGCGDTVTVVINSSGSMTSSNVNTDPLCFGSCDGTATITPVGGSIPYVYSWSGSASNTNFSNDLCTGFHTVTITDNIGCVITDTFSLVEPVALNLSTTFVSPLCFGSSDGSIALAVTGGTANYTYLWDNIGASITQDISGIPSGTYNVAVTDVNNCIQNIQTVVTAPLQLTLTTSTDSVSCSVLCDGGIAAAITGGGSSPFQFSLDNTTFNGSGSFDFLCEGVYSVYIVDNQACLDSIIIEVFAQSFPADATIVPVVTLCENISPVQLFAADPGGVWSGTGISSSTLGIFDPALASSGSHEIIYTISGVCGNADTVSIDVLPADNVLITAATDVCEDDASFILSVQSGGGSWSGTGITNTVTGEFSPAVSGVGSFMIYYSTNGVCPQTDSAEQVVWSNDIPIIGVVGAMCLNDMPVNLAVNVPGGTWSGAGITDPVLGTFDPSIAGSGSHIVTYSLNSMCGGSDVIIIIVNGSQPGSIVLSNIGGCIPLTVNFSSSTGGNNQSCSWDLGDGTQLSNCNPFDYTFTAEGCYDISLTLVDSTGCVSSISAASQICTDQSPMAGFSYSPSEVLVYNALVQFTNESSNAVNYQWFISDILYSSNIETSYNFENNGVGVYPVCLVAENTLGCLDTICQEVNVVADFSIYVPNAFSPNGKGDNDYFYPVLNGAAPEDYMLNIFDRWGALIFVTTDYLEKWDGTFHGYQAQQDIYVWKISYREAGNDKVNVIRGHVSLLR
jgi:gliding motility-associated-like protein